MYFTRTTPAPFFILFPEQIVSAKMFLERVDETTLTGHSVESFAESVTAAEETGAVWEHIDRFEGEAGEQEQEGAIREGGSDYRAEWLALQAEENKFGGGGDGVGVEGGGSANTNEDAGASEAKRQLRMIYPDIEPTVLSTVLEDNRGNLSRAAEAIAALVFHSGPEISMASSTDDRKSEGNLLLDREDVTSTNPPPPPLGHIANGGQTRDLLDLLSFDESQPPPTPPAFDTAVSTEVAQVPLVGADGADESVDEPVLCIQCGTSVAPSGIVAEMYTGEGYFYCITCKACANTPACNEYHDTPTRITTHQNTVNFTHHRNRLELIRPISCSRCLCRVGV